MHEKQRAIYDLFLQRERQRVLGLLETGGLKAHRFEILRAITRMRQLCLHPGLVDPKYARVPSAKLDALIEHTEPVVSGGKKALVFSQFTSFLSRASARLDQSNVPHLYLDGSTGNRKSLIERFQTDAAVPLFLISLKAGGFGITLTAAEYCFLLDPWWNPAVETQAIDRTHRIGQTKRVVAYRFIMKNSIEEKVVKLQERKRALFANVLDKGDAFSSRVTEDDIRAIFD